MPRIKYSARKSICLRSRSQPNKSISKKTKTIKVRKEKIVPNIDVSTENTNEVINTSSILMKFDYSPKSKEVNLGKPNFIRNVHTRIVGNIEVSQPFAGKRKRNLVELNELDEDHPAKKMFKAEKTSKNRTNHGNRVA